MTDKQIIVDGIDVSGCDFLAKEDDYCSYSGVTYAYKGQCMCSDEEMCKEHPNCFYKKQLKQLKRKEQECEELKEEIAKATMEICNQCGEKDDYNIPCKQIRDLDYGLQLEIEENDKLKQTLAEIKEIAEKIDPLCIYEDWKCTDLDNTVECPAKAKCPRECRNKILQKISECEVGNE